MNKTKELTYSEITDLLENEQNIKNILDFFCYMTAKEDIIEDFISAFKQKSEDFKRVINKKN